MVLNAANGSITKIFLYVRQDGFSEPMVSVSLLITSAQYLTKPMEYVLLATKDILLLTEFLFLLKIMNLMIYALVFGIGIIKSASNVLNAFTLTKLFKCVPISDLCFNYIAKGHCISCYPGYQLLHGDGKIQNLLCKTLYSGKCTGCYNREVIYKS